ncbi:hypothetical protein GCM10023224_05250 [Streptomonospora halophila]|uniref:YspA cpYpsA-related SLOG domain-containing protein n=1 Tax=Streptomonospora halophila TaxID=427369 RepID=A0ABP9G661_9ACTN
MRIIVTGGRDYGDADTVERALRGHLPGPHTIVHGGAPGADRLAHSVARGLDWELEPHPADWERHGRAAGPIRNVEMARAGADLCIAFPGGRGTADMVARAEAAGTPVRRVAGEVT